jgi:ADP-heptose:LPS heptosyltransferase
MLVPEVSKIAVLRANALGDFIFSLPALDALRAGYPNAQLTLLGAPWHAEFLAGRPGPVDRVLVVPALPGIREPVAEDPGPPLAEFLEAARAEHFDLALQLHGGGRHSNPLVAELGARVTAGLRAPDAVPLERWLRYDYYQPEVFRYLEVAGLVGAAPVGWQPRLEPTEADLVEAKRVAGAPAGLRVALHPGATDPRRRWPPARFAAVGDALYDAGAEVLVTGARAEHEVVRKVLLGMRRPARAVLGELSIGGLAGLYAGCRLVVSNDTGPLHLAQAVGAATVGVYWVGNMINGGPTYRARHRPLISWTVHCPACGQDCVRRERCPHDPSFVADVPTGEVRLAALELLTCS